MVIEVFSPSLRKLWKEWELRLIILLSLTCQIILMLLGNRRRYTKSLLLQIMLWSAYLAADSLATFGLGAISSDLNDAALDHTGPPDSSLELEAFWTPFFLLHLGGVDTITAYAPEDNELWLRQLLNFVVQTGMVIYVILLAWSGSHLSILSIFVLVAGIINYGERSYALWCASSRQRKARVNIGKMSESSYEQFGENQRHAIAMSIVTEYLFADVPIEIFRVQLWRVMGVYCTAGVELVELGLALMYDSLYTKTKVSHSAWGAAMRCICFLLSCVSLVLFCILNNQEKYSKIDLSITLALLTMAVLKEIHGAFVVLTSYTTLFWLTCFTASKTNVIFALTMEWLKRITAFSWLRSPKWSNSMGQCSLLSYFLNEEPKGRRGILKLLGLSTKWKKEGKLYETCHVVPVQHDIKQWIYDYYSQNWVDYTGTSSGKQSVAKWDANHQDDHLPVLEGYDIWGIIVAWHLVTEVCCSLDRKHLGSGVETGSQNVHLSSKIKISKYISRYMMYLVVTTPEMLSSGSEHFQKSLSHNLIGFQKLCSATVKEWSYDELEEEEEAIDETQTGKKTREVRIRACGNFVDEYYEIIGLHSPYSEIIRNWAGILEALKPATGETEENETKVQERWELLSGVWMELLTFAATQGRGNDHAQLLSQGGEVLTYTWVVHTAGEINCGLLR